MVSGRCMWIVISGAARRHVVVVVRAGFPSGGAGPRTRRRQSQTSHKSNAPQMGKRERQSGASSGSARWHIVRRHQIGGLYQALVAAVFVACERNWCVHDVLVFIGTQVTLTYTLIVYDIVTRAPV